MRRWTRRGRRLQLVAVAILVLGLVAGLVARWVGCPPDLVTMALCAVLMGSAALQAFNFFRNTTY